ncbi:MerR family transcriptional regulator [Terrilactibacillus laevilacticus]|uniref:Helix-turn-helix domain-containing protein n=1 Tax=Terrilactibacillus laevilacticus TaxID=1380157 RepID=A0ABW5PKZ0_9BACI|nr:helix-turn-helix domain-containing protein [Terrilactibacillus laevilacticus]
MKKLTISKMAQLRGLSVDTLRHYDKIGLFKPSEVDPKTGYRYYSILQYEVLGTIKELRQIGMPIKEIKAFMSNRNVEQSLNLLKKSIADIESQIIELKKISSILSQRVSHIEQFKDTYRKASIVLKKFKKREYILLPRIVNMDDEETSSYGFIELEKKVKGTIPILASNRFGDILTKDYLNQVRQTSSPINIPKSEMFIIVEGDAVDQNIKTFEEGTFICSYYRGFDPQKRFECLKSLIDYCDDQGWDIIGDALHIIQIDITITDQVEEACYEIQIPVNP